ncbi:TetR/AcrR family transcriptional regulator [Pseudactinotalea sp.]|uniref:TetR/AcrR family transcriptional regulator n=1 Tax=Pseudactinotalea sp. TaxID=1926260 RepID=UPI003B3A0952
MSTAAPVTFTERARRAQILEAAISTVNEVGYPRASLAEIARRAGVAKSAIVYYFATKDALLMHVIEHVFEAMDRALVDAVAPLTDPQERLRAYVIAYLEHVDGHRAAVTAGIEIVVSHRNADGVPLYLAGTEDDSALLRGILREGMEQGAFRSIPLEVAVAMVEALLDVPSTALQRDLDADLSHVLPEIVTMVFRSLSG